MARAVPGFNPDQFRAGIRLAMTVGAPPNTSDQPLFTFPRQAANTSPADEDGLPFDPAARPELTTRAPVRVTCAVDYDDANARVENIGVVIPSTVKITLLDEEYVQVKGCNAVIIGGDRYLYRFTEPPVGLDTVGVWTIHFIAEDDA